MAEAEAAPSQQSQNTRNLKKHASRYGMAVVAALTLFGAAHTWATSSGWPIAFASGLAAALIAGMVLSSIFHEWGHYTGAALAGSNIRILEEPANNYFFLGFNPRKNSKRQALWLTWGGIGGSWLLVLLIALLIPLNNWMSAVLLATAVGRAVNASVFEVPIAMQTRSGKDFKEALNARLASPGVVQAPGLAVGLGLLALGLVQ